MRRSFPDMSGNKAYIGACWNHSSGEPILTLQDREASILSSAIAILVSFVASQAWNILKFAFHQVRASKVGDELHIQQQVVLRTPSG